MFVKDEDDEESLLFIVSWTTGEIISDQNMKRFLRLTRTRRAETTY